MIHKEEVLKYIVAARPWSLPASIMPALLGSMLAYQERPEKFNFSIAIATIVCVICIHIAGNLINTYYDFVKGIDGQNSDDHTLVDGILKPENIMTFSIVSYFLSCLICVTFLTLMNIEPSIIIVSLFGTGLVLSFFYTGGLGLKYVALGDAVIVCTFGPVTVLYAFAAQTNFVSWKPVVMVLPLVSFCEAILHANNSRDSLEDQKKGIKTLAILLGNHWSFRFYMFLVLSPFVCSLYVGMAVNKQFLLPLLSFPHAVSLLRRFEDWDLQQLPQQTAQLNMLYGVLYIASLISTY